MGTPVWDEGTAVVLLATGLGTCPESFVCLTVLGFDSGFNVFQGKEYIRTKHVFIIKRKLSILALVN